MFTIKSSFGDVWPEAKLEATGAVPSHPYPVTDISATRSLESTRGVHCMRSLRP